MKRIYVMGIVLGIALIIFGIVFPTPKKYIMVKGYDSDLQWIDESGSEYVGGDAYNYQMEASLKAGYMGGVLAMKTIAFVGGLLLLFLSLYSNARTSEIEELSMYITRLVQGSDNKEEALEKLCKTSEEQIRNMDILCRTVNELLPKEEKEQQI